MMQDTKANSRHCACCMTSSGGQEWLLRCRRQVEAVSNASNMKAFMPKPQCDPSVSLLLWELLHMDVTSIEITMELDQPLYMVNILVFCYHFMKYIMAYLTPNQTVKTVPKFLWQGYISIFGVLAKLLSD